MDSLKYTNFFFHFPINTHNQSGNAPAFAEQKVAAATGRADHICFDRSSAAPGHLATVLGVAQRPPLHADLNVSVQINESYPSH